MKQTETIKWFSAKTKKDLKQHVHITKAEEVNKFRTLRIITCNNIASISLTDSLTDYLSQRIMEIYSEAIVEIGNMAVI